jgi:predicted  nucleic acid-binding Zn-ribbon protein
MHTHGETIQLLEEQIKELQDRLSTSDEKLKASMGKNLMISEDRVKTLQNKVGQLNKHIKELEDEIDRLEE